MVQPVKNELYAALTFEGKRELDATESFKFRAKQVHGYRYDYSKSKYRGCHADIEVICHLHGSFNTTPTQHINSKSNCPYCSSNRYTPELFLKSVNRIHGSKYKYHDVELIQFRKSMDVIKIECPSHGIFYQRLDVHLKGNGCPECSDKPYNHGNAAIYKAQRLAYLGE